MPRIKVEGEDGWYHIRNAAAGEKRAFPLQKPSVQKKSAKFRRKREKWHLRRKNAVKQLDGAFYTLREQRDNYVPT